MKRMRHHQRQCQSRQRQLQRCLCLHLNQWSNSVQSSTVWQPIKLPPFARPIPSVRPCVCPWQVGALRKLCEIGLRYREWIWSHHRTTRGPHNQPHDHLPPPKKKHAEHRARCGVSLPSCLQTLHIHVGLSNIDIAACIFLILYKTVTYSRVFHPCYLVPRFPLPRFQSPLPRPPNNVIN